MRDNNVISIEKLSEIIGVQPHVLLYWEFQFPQLCPEKNEEGHRVYRSSDVETVRRIRELLYEAKHTIESARLELDKRD